MRDLKNHDGLAPVTSLPFKIIEKRGVSARGFGQPGMVFRIPPGCYLPTTIRSYRPCDPTCDLEVVKSQPKPYEPARPTY